jgi:hypothetical protein
MHPTSFRVGASALVFAMTVSSAAMAERITLQSQTARWADATGLRDWAGASITTYAMSNTPAGNLTAVRPNGQGTWDRDFSTNNQIEWGPGWINNPSLGWPVPSTTHPTLSQVHSWSESNFKGSWSIGWGGDTFSYDTTPNWTAAADRTYATLTGASVTALNAARAGGASGSLTLSMSQSVQSYGATGAMLLLRSFSGGYAESVTISSGSDFSFSGLPAVPTDTIAILRLWTAGGWNTVGAHEVRVMLDADTFYGPTVVPGPGALALLGIAGAATGSRRRRR